MRTQPRISFGPELLSWGSSIEVDESGAEFNPDIGTLMNIINIDSEAAFKLSTAAIEGLLAVRMNRLKPEGAERLCRVLAPLADTLRHRGDRNSACDLLDLAFQIEGHLQNLGLRSYLLRTSSYLLSDLALWSDADRFAAESVALAVLAADQRGLSRSLYVRSEMLSRLGSCRSAMSHLQACLGFVPPEDQSTRLAARFALAYVRYEAGELRTAINDFREIEQELGTKTGRDFAKILMVQAEVYSKLGELNAADDRFEAAQAAFAVAGNAEDVAICGLQQMSHLLRTGRPHESNALAQTLMPLAVQLRGNKVGQATLLQILRLSAQGQLTVKALEESLQSWTQPWKKRRTR
ncbi:MAG: hypothetical protein AAGM22_27110 [Acidobacteriota bacterium]